MRKFLWMSGVIAASAWAYLGSGEAAEMAVFLHTQGVLNAVSGYAGGQKETASYEMIRSGRTGHAESAQISYDPTQLNRQSPDVRPLLRHLRWSPSRQAIASSSTRTASSTGITGRTCISKAGKVEQHL